MSNPRQYIYSKIPKSKTQRSTQNRGQKDCKSEGTRISAMGKYFSIYYRETASSKYQQYIHLNKTWIMIITFDIPTWIKEISQIYPTIQKTSYQLLMDAEREKSVFPRTKLASRTSNSKWSKIKTCTGATISELKVPCVEYVCMHICTVCNYNN